MLVGIRVILVGGAKLQVGNGARFVFLQEG